MPRRTNWRNAIAFAHDVAATALAWCLAYLFRLNFELEQPFASAMVAPLELGCAAPGTVLPGARDVSRSVALRELPRPAPNRCSPPSLGAMAIALVILLFRIPWVPRSVLLLYPILLAAMMGGSRIAYRAWKEGHLSRLGERRWAAGRRARRGRRGGEPLGQPWSQRRMELRRAPRRRPDEAPARDPWRAGPRLARRTCPRSRPTREVELAIIAMPKASHRVRRARARALLAGRDRGDDRALPTRTSSSGKVTVSQLRRVELDDLLGRDPVTLDSAGLNDVAARPRGARDRRGRLDRLGAVPADPAGSRPARLVALETNEHALYNLEQELGSRSGRRRISPTSSATSRTPGASTRCSRSSALRRSSTPPRTSTCR